MICERECSCVNTILLPGICLETFKRCLFSVPTSYRSNLCMPKTAVFSYKVQINVISMQATTYHMHPIQKKLLLMSMCPKIAENRMSHT